MLTFRRRINQKNLIRKRFIYCRVKLTLKYFVPLIKNEIDSLIYLLVEFATLFTKFD